MQELDDQAARMLAALYEAVGGDSSKTAGMWAVGEKLGLDRAVTEDTAMNLASQGLVEIRSLSGALGLTPEGLAMAGGGAAPVGGDAGDVTLAEFTAELLAGLGELNLSVDDRRNLEVDAGALGLLSRRPTPLPEVIKGLLAEVSRALDSSSTPTAARLAAMIKTIA